MAGDEGLMAYAQLSTRNHSGFHPGFTGLGSTWSPARRSLGAAGAVTNPTLTPQAAMQQAISESSGLHLNPKDFQNQSYLQTAEAEVAAGQLNVQTYTGSSCAGGAPSMNMLQTAEGLSLTATSATTGILAATHVIPALAVPVVGWIVAGVGAIIGLISAIFQHHAAAVKRDMAFACAVIPAVNNAFSLIAKGVQAGQILPGDAANSLDQIYTEFQSAGGNGAINFHPYCNSNCEAGVILKAMVLYWKSQYAAMAAQQAASAASAAQTSQGGSTAQQIAAGISPVATGVSQIPSWAWLVAAAFGLWAVS